jgi:hypothetical protein
LGSLLTDPMSPAMPNPQRQLLAEQLGVRPIEVPPIPGRTPTMEQLAAIRDVSRVAPVPAPTGIDARPQDPSLRAAPSPASGPAAGRPGGATEVPGFGGGKVDNSRLPTLAVAEPSDRQTAVLPSGARVEIGRSYIVGDTLRIAEMGPDGKAVLRDVKDTLPFGLSFLTEKSLAGDAARLVAAPMIKQQLGQAGTALKDAAGGMFGEVSQLVGSIASQAKNTIGSMFEPKTLAATPPRDVADERASCRPGAGAYTRSARGHVCVHTAYGKTGCRSRCAYHEDDRQPRLR